MSDYPMLISNKLHSFRNFDSAKIRYFYDIYMTFMLQNTKKIVESIANQKGMSTFATA